MKKVCIVMPVRNEEERIKLILEKYPKFFGRLKKEKKLDFEIIIIINGTTDNTEKTVKDYAKKHKEISYFKFEQGGERIRNY